MRLKDRDCNLLEKPPFLGENFDDFSSNDFESDDESLNFMDFMKIGGKNCCEVEESGANISDSDDFFDSDHITTYLREVSEYYLLTPEREMELAEIIRKGQNELMELVAEESKRDNFFKQIHAKIQKLHAKEEHFPGVRDKILKVVKRSIDQAVKKFPDNEHYRKLKQRCESIIEKINRAKNEMVRGNLRLVLSIAKRYRGRGMSFDDLIQEGNLGLLKAVGRYDHTKGNRFSTYATWWVRQSIIRGIYDKTRTIRLPVHFIELRNLYHKVYHELFKELGREPTPEEIAERAKVPLERIETVMTITGQPLSLETPVGDDEQKLGDFIEDTSSDSPADNMRDKELYEVLRRLLATLQPREEKILRLRFGIDGNPEETLEKIGRSFNVSKERIRQIEKKALQKLQHPKRRVLLEPFLE